MSNDISLVNEKNSEEVVDDGGFDLNKELENISKKMVSPPIITSHKLYEEFTSETDKKNIIIYGEAIANSKIELKINGKTSDKLYQADSYGKFRIEDGVELIEGQNIVNLYSINSSGIISEPTKLIFILNVKRALDFKIYEDSQSLKEIDQYYYSRSYEPQAFIPGKGIPLSEVYLKINDKIIASTQSDSSGNFSFDGVKLDRGENSISLWCLNLNQEPSTPVIKTVLVLNDTLSPEPVSMSGYVSGDGNYLNWEKSSDAEFLSYKIVRVDEPCKNPQYPTDNVIATITDNSVTSYKDDNVISGKAYFYTLWVVDKAGNLISSNILPLPAPKYYITLKKMENIQGNVIARRQWYTQYYEITNTGNVPLNIQPVFDFFILNPESDPEMALNPLWAVYIWDPNTGTNYYSNEDIKVSQVADWINVYGTESVEETVTYNNDKSVKTTTIVTTIRQTQEKDGKRIAVSTVTTRIIKTETATGKIISDTSSSDSSESIVEPEKVGSPIPGIQPGQTIRIAVKIVNVAADNGDKITVHFHFAPADCQGYFFTEDMASTGDIQVTSSGK
ncbi:MAG: hypothetical protein PHU65_02675 [Actinomycetota bacterium]|nr:hypothetical protein [Actinomycetota bacterium]